MPPRHTLRTNHPSIINALSINYHYATHIRPMYYQHAILCAINQWNATMLWFPPYTINPLSICSRYAIDMRMRAQCAINILSTCYTWAINLLSTCYHRAINMLRMCSCLPRHMLSISIDTLAIRYSWAINVLSVFSQDATNALLNCYQYAINMLCPPIYY